MKVSLRIIRDSWNSYPKDELEFTITDELVHIEIAAEEGVRSISISRDEFVELLKFLTI